MENRNIAVRLRFVGTAYHGWQLQKEQSTVCSAVTLALEKTTGDKVKLTGCGRTDAGVHAERYVANFSTACSIPTDKLPLALNTALPDDICANAACEVSDRFDATRSCSKKEYTYRIWQGSFHDPFLAGRMWPYSRRLDEKLMDETAQAFVGVHDFAAMQSAGTVLHSTVREVYDFSVSRVGEVIEFRVSASGFLYNMARAMVGTLVYVAEGKLAPGDISGILSGRDRAQAGPTAPAQGLYMTGVWYPRGEVGFDAGPG